MLDSFNRECVKKQRMRHMTTSAGEYVKMFKLILYLKYILISVLRILLTILCAVFFSIYFLLN